MRSVAGVRPVRKRRVFIGHGHENPRLRHLMPLPIDTCAANLDGMRGAGDPLTIGERIAFYRRRRGLSQATLAGLVGNGEDWLSKVEQGGAL